MANIYVEAKGPKGAQLTESLTPTAVAGYLRGLFVKYGADSLTALLVGAAASSALGVLDEDAVSVKSPCRVIEFGQAVAQIGANVSKGAPLATDVNSRLVPALPGQPVVAIALEDQTYVAANSAGATSFATVFVLGLESYVQRGSAPSHVIVAGAIPVVSGVYGLGSAGALAMTLATPTAAQDGTRITVVSETAQAHTVTTAANKINGNKLSVTFSAVGQSVDLLAMGGIWFETALVGAVLA